jgi:hypothetical protein
MRIPACIYFELLIIPMSSTKKIYDWPKNCLSRSFFAKIESVFKRLDAYMRIPLVLFSFDLLQDRLKVSKMVDIYLVIICGI